MNPTVVRFLEVNDVRILHLITIRDQGGDPSVRDLGLLDSAMAMPRQSFGGAYVHNDIPSMAAAYAFHICKNHPFIDGNKRAAFAAMVAFLQLNGWRFTGGIDESEAAIIRTAASEWSKESLTEWVASHCREKPRLELREFFAQVTFELLSEQMQAFSLSNSNEAIQSSVNEAKVAIPALARIDQVAEEQVRTPAESKEQRESQLMFQSMSILLGAIYRIAEDMGYEW